jgi:transcriptional regulator with XRE-family HTH domain
MNLGNKIKELRQRNCITQEQLANHLSVSPQCISKWENSITMPDIQLLPQISVFFGVSLDELFDLTDSAYLERISNMIRNKRFPEESEFRWAEKFLKGKIESGISKGECSTLLADLYNHMADGYRFKAECSAKEAIAIDPEKKYNHSLLRMAQQGSIPDWNYANHSKRIAFYQNFVSEHPNYERGYFFLLDELLADYRLKEAEIVLDKMRFQCDNLRVPLYCGLILWQKGKQEQAQQSWAEMLKQYSSDWLAYACMGDCMAKICHYGEAILNYRKALELQ